MNFLLGQCLFNNIFCVTWIIPHPRKNQEISIKGNWIKVKHESNKIK